MANDILGRDLPTSKLFNPDAWADAYSAIHLSASSPEMLAKVREFEELLRTVEQQDVVIEHVLHGGMYSRTVRLPAGVPAVGALIEVPTLLIIHGDVDMLAGDECVEVRGYGVFPGFAGRKALFVTRSAVEMTMVFPTQANTAEEAERELTREHGNLTKSLKDRFWKTGE